MRWFPVRRLLHRRSAWALAVSLLLHALLVLLVVFLPEDKGSAPMAPKPIELEIVVLEPKPKEPEQPKPAEPRPPQPVKPPVARGTAKKKTAEIVIAPAPSAPGPASSSAPSAGPRTLDAPRDVTLVPGGEFAIKAGGDGLDVEGPRGHTIVNSPEEQPDAVAMQEYTQEKLGRRTGAMVEGMVADAKSRNGLVDPYFMGARSAMEAEMSAGAVPLPKDKNALREGVKGFMQNQERFGKTGSPFAAGDEPKWKDYSIARNENQGMAMQLRDPEWGAVMRQAEQSMAAGEATSRVMDHAWVEAILELVQEPGGGVADAHIVKSSGSREFDEYVLHRARKVFLKLEDPPQEGHGISSAGWRTLWKFSYWPMSIADKRGQRVRVELLRVEKGQGSGNPLEHVGP